MAADYDHIREENMREYGHGERHLAFLGQLYAERPHFIFELLQNAEDAGATRIFFRLLEDGLDVLHNGRPFSEADVRGVCGVGDGTKADDLTTIGRFGIGFKSVYAYTRTPHIYSGDESFAIDKFVRPRAVEPREAAGDHTTQFFFPFDHPTIGKTQAHREVADALAGLSSRTLVFLRNLQRINWSTPKTRGFHRREVKEAQAATTVRIDVEEGKRKRSERWLRFARPVTVEGTELEVAVAFHLGVHVETKRLSVQRVQNSGLVVFFPTAKETHLGFLVHGPYRTTPARDNVPPEDLTNQKLVSETARLIVETALPALKRNGALTVDAIQALPIDESFFAKGTMFRPIFTKVRDTLRTSAYLPSHDGGFATAVEGRLAVGQEQRELFDAAALTDLLGRPARWLAGDIGPRNTPELYRYLVGHRNSGIEPLSEGMELDADAMVGRLRVPFMVGRTDEWLARLYGYLGNQQSQMSRLRRMPILKLESDKFAPAEKGDGGPGAYLPSDYDSAFPTVKRMIAENAKALEFLVRLGLERPDTTDEVYDGLLPRYANGGVGAIAPEQNLNDVRGILAAVAASSGKKKERLIARASATPFLRAVVPASGDVVWAAPDEAYGATDDLTRYFKGSTDARILDPIYREVEGGLTELGVATEPRVDAREPREDGRVWAISRHSQHVVGEDHFDPFFDIDGLAEALRRKDADVARYVWNQLLAPNWPALAGVVVSASRQDLSNGVRKDGVSPAGRIARELAWLPCADGVFRVPSDAALEDLPEDFVREDGLVDVLKMKTGGISAIADEVGVPAEFLRAAKANPELVKRFMAAVSAGVTSGGPAEAAVEGDEPLIFRDELVAALERPGSTDRDDDDVPPGGPSNPDAYRAGLSKALTDAKSQEPSRADRVALVLRRVWDGKNAEVRDFLMEQYRGRCQICDTTFPRRDGLPYFEGLYLVSRLRKKWLDHPGNVLCLCPSCCAKVQHGSLEVEDLDAQLAAFETPTGRHSLRLLLIGEPAEVRFTERHALRLGALLRGDGGGSKEE